MWGVAQSCSDQPLKDFYVPELKDYIEPKETPVGALLRSLSEIPGRLNLTTMHSVDDEVV